MLRKSEGYDLQRDNIKLFSTDTITLESSKRTRSLQACCYDGSLANRMADHVAN